MERIITKSFARLMGRGTHRGFITYEELNKSLGKRNLSDENLAQAFIHILDEKVIFSLSLLLSELRFFSLTVLCLRPRGNLRDCFIHLCKSLGKFLWL